MRFSILGLALAAGLVACKEGGPTVQDPGDGSPAIAILVTPGSLPLPQGGTGSVAVAATRSGGFTGEITIGVEGLPTGVVATASPATIPVGGSATTVSLSVGGAAAAGSYTITVRASGPGVTAKTATFTLTITAVSVPGYTLVVAPQTLSIVQGTSASATITVTRVGGFTGGINLAATGLPAGINANITPPVVVDQVSTLTVGAAFNVPVGTYTFTVEATASGMTPRTATITVQVTPSNPVGEVSYQFCAASGVPVWFAYQDGAGGWSRVTPTNNVFAFDLVANRGGVAWAMATAGGGYVLDVFWGSETELNVRGQGICSGSGTTRTLAGSVSGVGPTEQAWLQFPGATAVVVPAVASTFSISNVLDAGAFDVLGSRVSIGQTGAITLLRLLMRRSINPATGQSLPVFDFTGAESFDPEGHSLAISNLGTDETRIVMSYYSSGRLMGAYFADGPAVGGSLRTYPAIPGSRQSTGDLHVLSLFASPPGTATPTATRSATLMMRSAVDRSITLGPALGNVTVTTLPGAYARLRAQYPLQIDYNTFWAFGGVQATQNRSVSLAMTAAYVGGVSVVDIAVPDFSSVQGWDANWAPRTGVATNWTFSASGWLAAGGLDRPPFVDGTLGLSGTRSGQITP